MAAVSQTSHAASLTTFPSEQASIRPVSPSESDPHEANTAPSAVRQQVVDPPTSPAPHAPRHGTSPSTNSIPRLQQRSSSGIFSLAAAALDKTQTAFANISDPVIRPRNSLARLSLVPGSLPASEPASPVKKPVFRTPSTQSLTASPAVDGKQPAAAAPAKVVPLSQPYSETDPNRPPPVRQSPTDSKMHQTSSRLLRMTDDERPFTKVSESADFRLRGGGGRGSCQIGLVFLRQPNQADALRHTERDTAPHACLRLPDRPPPPQGPTLSLPPI